MRYLQPCWGPQTGLSVCCVVLGHTLARPTIALLPNGRWAAIVGNGYEHNATGTPTSGQAELFVIFLDGGLDRNWTEGRDYLRIPTGVGSVTCDTRVTIPYVISFIVV